MGVTPGLAGSALLSMQETGQKGCVSAQFLFDLLAKSQKSYKILLENAPYAQNRYTKLQNESLDSAISSLLL